ncbi:MAG: DUF2284 domain-containing protein [Lachnospiraceae bacterium]|nr:DUF2284 domain-containing protein [Lachnospiraceae bacterium]
MNTIEKIESIITEYPICEYCFGNTSQIPFSDKVLFICETDCTRYKHCWACPPHAGSIHDNIQKCHTYEHFLLFSTVTEVSDSWNTEVCLEAKKAHEALTRELRVQIEESVPSIYMLSTGCAICDVCACPEEPCRHPEERLMSTESHGIVLMQLVEEMGLCFNYGSDIAVYFSMVLF